MNCSNATCYSLILVLLTSCYKECPYADGSAKPDNYLSVHIQNRSADHISEIRYPQVNQSIIVDGDPVMKLPLLNGFNATSLLLIYSSQKRDTLEFSYSKSLRYDNNCELLTIQPKSLILERTTCDSFLFISGQLTLYK